jgi:hypothetical protein
MARCRTAHRLAAARNDLTPNQRRIIDLLATLDAQPMPDGTRIRMCANRRRLRASAEAMQELYRRGIGSGAGSREPWGTGNTPASAWWWLTAAGLRLGTRAWEHDAIRRSLTTARLGDVDTVPATRQSGSPRERGALAGDYFQKNRQ